MSSLLFCYVVFPFVYRHLSRYLTLAVLLAYAAICWLIPYDQVNAVLYVFPLVRFVHFYLGMLLCRLYERKPGMDVRSWMEVLLVVLLFVALTVYPFMDAKLRNAPLFWLVLLPLILVFAQESGVVSRLLKSRPMFFLGSLTMPLFLTHQILIGILLHRLPEMPAMLMLAVCIFVILMISWDVQIIISRLIRL